MELVEVAGLEPATPCLQSKLENAMWLSRLAFTYVAMHGFRGVFSGVCSQFLSNIFLTLTFCLTVVSGPTAFLRVVKHYHTCGKLGPYA